MVVLATKVYVSGDARDRTLDSLRSLVGNAVGELDVSYEVGVRHDQFPSVTIEGEDAVAARNVLREEWGAITDTFEPGETYVGTLEEWDEERFVLDAGRRIEIPAEQLGLGPGTPVQIRERFGIVQHTPLQFVYEGGETDAAADVDAENDATDADAENAAERDANAPHRLADETRDRLYEWTRGPGRVNVNSATRAEVRATVNRAGHARDIVTVERLGLLEQSIVCAEDTDPPGLLASIGGYLPAELRAVVP